MDYRRLRLIPIIDVARYMQVELKRYGANPRGVCPLCGHNSFALTPQKGLWYCFKCRQHGDGLELVVRMRMLTHTEAAKLLVETFGGP